MCKSIPLSQGVVALVDDEDYERLRQYTWFLSGTGYAVGFVPANGRFDLVYMHRLILNVGPEQLVDHVNPGDKLDNRRNNLRLATPRQNGQNKRVSAISTTGLKGVGWHKNRRKYHARIQIQGTRYHLGFFDDAREAALAYDSAARTLFGAFALCNYPDEKTPRSVAILVRERLRHRGWKLE